VVVTGLWHGAVGGAGMKNGAYDYVTSLQYGRAAAVAERVAGVLKLKTENRILREKVNPQQGFGGLLGRAPRWRSFIELCQGCA